jgi:chromate transporter
MMEATAAPEPSGEPASYGWPAARPPLLDQLWMWLWIGARSFGGGPAVQLMVYEALVTRRRWLSPAEYSRTWGLCQVIPGINLFSLAALVGYRVGGAAGVVAGLAGMAVPGSLVCGLCTIGYAHIAGSSLTRAGLRGGIAGVAGMGLFMAIRLLWPQLEESAGEGGWSVVASIGVFAGAAAGFFFLPRLPIVLVFLAAGVLMAGIGLLRRSRP